MLPLASLKVPFQRLLQQLPEQQPLQGFIVLLLLMGWICNQAITQTAPLAEQTNSAP